MSAKNDKKSKAKGRGRFAFDIDNPVLPPEIADRALASGGFPYDEELKKKPYSESLMELQLELLKLQEHVQLQGERLVALFEGRDASGKGSCINRFLERLNPRHARSVALSKPNEVERGQWYFQRYVSHLPTAGDMVLFDRSWYNRAGVERVMSFCTLAQTDALLRDAPDFEALLVRDGIHLFKFFLVIGPEMQLVRFHERRHDPFKRWKITDIDLAAIDKWDDYTRAQEDIFKRTSTSEAPWIVVRANDQRRARLETIRWVLYHSDYAGKDAKVVGEPDAKIIGTGPEYLGSE
ncbi:MAG: polyphosphate kinase 2 [Hyphomicrobium sp.]|jgi:polyphosphate kinase 2